MNKFINQEDERKSCLQLWIREMKTHWKSILSVQEN